MEIRDYTSINPDEILGLYAAVGWTNYVARPEMLDQAYRNSLCVLAAYDGSRLVGIIRAVGDGCSIVFIQDLIVLPEYQRRGIGTKLLREMTERYKTAYQIELLTDSTEKSKSFYRSAGFRPTEEIGCISFIRM